MQITMKFKDDIIALVDHVKALQSKNGDIQKDTPLSKSATNNGSFIKDLRDWSGGKPSPTLASVMILENYLRDQIGDEEYQRFIKSRSIASTKN